MEKITTGIRNPDKHPGSATLDTRLFSCQTLVLTSNASMRIQGDLSFMRGCGSGFDTPAFFYKDSVALVV
jgi:hypothetical protein